MNQLLLWITRNRPMKQIDVLGRPYLQRYCLLSVFGYQVWLHRFLSSDGDRHIHSHPWWAVTMIISGRYMEERRYGTVLRGRWIPKRITPRTVHRIASVEPNTWTLMLVGRTRRDTWHFIDEHGCKEWMQTSPRDWWKNCGIREG